MATNSMNIKNRKADNVSQNSLLKWNDRHIGQDIFVVGSSPQLLDIDTYQLAALEKCIIVGGNCTFYKIPLTYFLSAYTPHVLLASLYLQNDQLIKLDSLKEKTKIPFVEHLTRTIYSEIPGLTRYLTQEKPYIMTLRNQILAITHLAAIMGAKRIIFLGVDQRNHSYFWQKDQKIIQYLRQDLHKIQTTKYSQYYDLLDCKELFDNLYDFLHEHPSIQEKKAFYYDFKNLFQAYFHDLERYGIEPIATLEGSVVHKAGAKLLSLDKILEITRDTNIKKIKCIEEKFIHDQPALSYTQKHKKNAFCQQLEDSHEELDRKIKRWKALYSSGKIQTSLDSIYSYLSFKEARLSHPSLKLITDTLKNFNCMSRNYDFINDKIYNCTQSQEQNAALILLSWMLAIPSGVEKLMPNLDESLINQDYLSKIKSMSFRVFHEGAIKNSKNNNVILILDSAVDPRIIFDIAQINRSRKVTCLVPPNVETYINSRKVGDSLPIGTEVQTINPNFSFDKNRDAQYEYEIEEISQKVVKFIKQVTQNKKLSKLINTYSRPISIKLEDQLFQKSNFALECLNYIHDLLPGKIIIIFGNHSWLLFMIYTLSQTSYQDILTYYTYYPLKATTKGTPPMHEYNLLQNNKEFNKSNKKEDTELVQAVQEQSKSLFKAQKPSIALVADLNPKNFRVKSFFQPSFFKILFRKFNLIVIHSKPPLSSITDTILNTSIQEETHHNLQKYCTFVNVNDKITLFESERTRFSLSFINRFRSHEDFRFELSKFNLVNSLSMEFIEHCLYIFLKEDFLICLFYAECSIKTFNSESNLYSLLLLGTAERHILGQILTITAKEKSIPSYGYYHLFLSKSPRYKQPIVDYALVSDTYLFNLFQNHFKIPKKQIFVVGSHLVDQHRQEATAMKKKSEKQWLSKKLNTKQFLIAYIAQPFLYESLEALEKLITTCQRQRISCYITVKIHPSERKRNIKAYEKLIDKLNAKEWVSIVRDCDLTQLLINSNLMVTLFSNVAIEAAVLDRHVLSIEVESKPYPINLADIGIAISAKTDKELTTIIPELLYGGYASQLCKKRREAFFQKNPKLLAGSTINRIAHLLV